MASFTSPNTSRMFWPALFLCYVLLAASADTVVLKSGALVSAPDIAETEDSYLVDLGQDKPVAIAKAEVLRFERSAAALYRRNPSGQAFANVRAAAKKVAESSVLVRTPGSLGSGFVIDSRGYFITNAHVIDGSLKIEVTVFKQTGSGLQRQVHKKIRILALNRRDDLALLKIEPQQKLGKGQKPPGFESVPLGDSLAIAAGDDVFTMGSPHGLDRTVSAGTVSTAERELGGAGIFIQHDAPINPGNSGGPLFNLRGEVIGVNSRKFNSDGLGFAIPSSLVKFFLDHKDGYAFDPSSQNAGYIYNRPPTAPGHRSSRQPDS